MKRVAGVALIIFGLFVLLTSLPSLFSSFNNVTAEKEWSKEVVSFEQIRLSSTSIDFDIETYQGTEVIVQLEGTDGRVKIQTTEQDAGLSIEIKEPGFSFFSFDFSREPERAVVQIPEKYADELDVRTVSGAIKVSRGLTLTELGLKTISGDIKITEVGATDALMSTTSGDIEIGQLKSKESVMKSTSGDILVDAMTGVINGKTTSGDIEIRIASENEATSLATVSGDVEVGLPFANAVFSIKTTSGEIKIEENLREQSIQSRSRSISGKIGEGEFPFFVSTISGDVDIQK